MIESNTLLMILIDASIKSAALLIAACAALLFMRSASAATKHMTWFLAAVACLIMPLLCASLPQWQILPQWLTAPGTPAAQSQTKLLTQTPQQLPPTPNQLEVTAPPRITTPVQSPETRVSGVRTTTDPTPAQPANTIANKNKNKTPTATITPPTKRTPTTYQSIITLIYILGCALTLLPLLLGNISIIRLSKRAFPGNEKNTALLNQLRQQLNITRQVRLIHAPQRCIPMTFGILRPVILLPTDLQSPRDVLLHELAHIKRKDCFVQCVVHIACALYWFNPLLWYASRRMRIERERACDDLVLQAGCKPSDYAQQLLTIAADLPVSSPRMAAFAGIAMARKSNLEGRMLAILDPKRNRKTLTRLGIAIGALLIACIVVPIAMLRAEQGEDPAIPSSALLGKDPVLPKTATKIKEAFDTFRVAMTSTKPPDRTITIKGDGTFTFKMQTLEKVPGNEKRLRRSKTPYVARYRLSPGHLRELTQLLKAANWLTLAIPKGSIPADSTKYAMTLTRSGQQHERIYHERDKPKAYIDLVRFLRRINRQEDLYYAITHTDGSFSPGHNLSVELDGVMGAKSMSRPYAPVLDYHRLVPPYAKILRRPMGVELQAVDGAKLMGYLKLESQRLTLEALALDLSSYDVPPELRKAAVKALGMMGAGRSLGALKEAAQTGDFWLRNDVAEVLLTAEQVLKKQDKFVASVRFIETTATEKWTMHTWNIKRPTDMKVFAGWVHQRADETMAEHVGGGGNNRRGSDDIRLSLTYWREGEFVHWKIKREVLAPGESGGLEITSKTKIARDSELKIHSPNLLLKIDSKAYRPLIQIDVMSKGQLQSRLSYVIRTAKFFDEKHEGLLGADDPVKRILNVGE